MSRLTCYASLAALTMIVLGGCVPQDRYDAVVMANRSLQEQLVNAEDERDAALSSLDSMRRQLSRAVEDRNAMQAAKADLERNLERLMDDYDALNRRLAELDIGPLEPEVELALAELARRYPDLITFDPRIGMLRFASDFTFDLGSVELKEEAQRSLRELSRVLQGEHARNLEVHVIGHTDNVPVSRPETRQRHINNVYLSAHRAISVRDALVREGVEPLRILFAGFGEHRPIVPNQPGGTVENRRVEIYLVPLTAVPEAALTAPQTPTSEQPQERQRAPVDVPQK